jgi:hypothetical protein
MSDTTRLALPRIVAAQAQKHVTHNDALQILDALVQISVLDRPRDDPPATPAEGDRCIVGTSPTSAFAGRPGALAAFDDGAWRFLTPRAGWIAHVRSDGTLLLHDGTRWRNLEGALRRLDNLDGLGIGSASDPGNAFVARIASALFTAKPAGEGGTGSIRLTLNRDLANGTGSLLWQTGWSGRAEAGLSGDDKWRLKVSADGGSWRDAIVADPASGAVSFPGGIADAGPGGLPAFRNLVVNGDFCIAQRGPGPFTLAAAPVFGFDRWRMSAASTVAATLSRTTNAPGQTAGPAGRYFTSFVVTSGNAASQAVLQTRLEDVARLAGRRVQLSFWYRAPAAAFAVDLQQSFGTGGSAVVTAMAAVALPAASAWTRRTLSVTLPDLSGKMVGDQSFLAIRFSLTGAAPATLDLADVQFEEGVAATALEPRPPALELNLARRIIRRSATSLNTTDLALEMAAPPIVSGTGPYDYAAEI